MKLQGHTVLITGGTSGIGFELANQLHQRGNKIIVTGRDEQRLAKALQRLKGIHGFQSDVSRLDDIQSLYSRVMSEFPSVNVLINNAGISKTVKLRRETSLVELTNEIDINLTGPIRLTSIFLPHLAKQDAAAIVNVTSGVAFVPLPTCPVYSATKTALHSFTLSLRMQLKNTSIKVFEFVPPPTQTEGLGDFDTSDMKGVKVMKVEDMVRICLAAMEKDKFEVCPGSSNQLRVLSRLAPQFILNQMSKGADQLPD